MEQMFQSDFAGAKFALRLLAPFYLADCVVETRHFADVLPALPATAGNDCTGQGAGEAHGSRVAIEGSAAVNRALDPGACLPRKPAGAGIPHQECVGARVLARP